MELVDIFNADPFRAVTLTTNINKRPFMPGFLESLGIFTPVPIRTVQFSVQITDEGTLKVIPTAPRGAPPYEQVIPAQQLRQFNTGRIAIGDTIQAHELQGILARNAFMPVCVGGCLGGEYLKTRRNDQVHCRKENFEQSFRETIVRRYLEEFAVNQAA